MASRTVKKHAGTSTLKKAPNKTLKKARLLKPEPEIVEDVEKLRKPAPVEDVRVVELSVKKGKSKKTGKLKKRSAKNGVATEEPERPSKSGPIKELSKHKQEKLHEGHVALESRKKKKIKKRRPAAEDDNVEEENKEDVPLRGMKKWLLDYHNKRPGLKVLQQEIDDFIENHEAQAEKERKEREAASAAEGWTVVVHHKGRKKTVDSESGIAIGSVGLAAAQAKNAKKKAKESAVTFYRFQRREARRNEIMELQNKFEEDKKRIAQMRAARKFRPY